MRHTFIIVFVIALAIFVIFIRIIHIAIFIFVRLSDSTGLSWSSSVIMNLKLQEYDEVCCNRT